MDRAKFITRCFSDDKDKDAASPIIKRTITCEGCRMSYTYNTTEEDAETVRKCNDCRRKSFLKVFMKLGAVKLTLEGPELLFLLKDLSH